jgi:hypothetical protein
MNIMANGIFKITKNTFGKHTPNWSTSFHSLFTLYILIQWELMGKCSNSRLLEQPVINLYTTSATEQNTYKYGQNAN